MRPSKRLSNGFLLILGCCFLPANAVAQRSVFDAAAFLNIVSAHHPLAKQAALQAEMGAATVLASRGAFDPKLFTDVSQKYLDDKSYYSFVQSEIKVPTPFGVDIKGGYEQNRGLFLNPEDNTPSGGLWYAGLSVPIGQGLLLDSRRTELRRARVYEQSTEAERRLLLNDLLYEAGQRYWDWFKAYNALRVYNEALAVARQRYTAVVQSAQLGDRPAIDTLEAGLQVQVRQIGMQQAQLDFDNAGAMLSVYLWAEGNVPLEIAPGTVPPSTEDTPGLPADEALYLRFSDLISQHPELLQYEFKVQDLKIDRRWKQEQLKPTLNLNYNALSQRTGDDTGIPYSVNDYKWGLEFSMPLFLRKERGKLQLADLKIQETQLDMATKAAMVNAKATAAFSTWEVSYEQATLFSQAVRDYSRLLAGEQQLFRSGESSLFMVNAREMDYISAQIKMIEFLAQNQKAILATRYALGMLGG